MRVLNTVPNQDVIEALRLDFALLLSSGKSLLQQRLEIEKLLEMYKQNKWIDKYENVKSCSNEISATIFCPFRFKVCVQLLP